MPSLVTDLTLHQRQWLSENQRTLSEESSTSQAAVATAPLDVDDRWGVMRVNQSSLDQSIFRARPHHLPNHPDHHHRHPGDDPEGHLHHHQHGMLPSSSPSWNMHHNSEPTPPHDFSPEPTTPEVEVDKQPQKRQRLSSYPYSIMPGGSSQFSEEQRDDDSRGELSSPLPPTMNHHNQNTNNNTKNDRNSNDTKSEPGDRFPEFPHGGTKLTWQQSYDNLLVYRDFHGDCHVPQKYAGNQKLGGWVNKQRKKKKNPAKYGRLTDEHLKLLTEAGFKWE